MADVVLLSDLSNKTNAIIQSTIDNYKKGLIQVIDDAGNEVIPFTLPESFKPPIGPYASFSLVNTEIEISDEKKITVPIHRDVKPGTHMFTRDFDKETLKKQFDKAKAAEGDKRTFGPMIKYQEAVDILQYTRSTAKKESEGKMKGGTRKSKPKPRRKSKPKTRRKPRRKPKKRSKPKRSKPKRRSTKKA